MNLFILLFSLFLSLSAVGDTSLGDTKTFFIVDDIQIEGAKKVEAEAILEKIESKKGLAVTNYVIRNDIKKIYEMKYFDSVEAHHLRIKNKNILKFIIIEKPIISKISFDGADEVSEDDLKEQLKTKEYNILDVNTIKSDIVTLQKFYEEKGFYLANITYDLVKNEFGGLDLIFKVKEFDKVSWLHKRKVSFQVLVAQEVSKSSFLKPMSKKLNITISLTDIYK